MKRFVTWLTVLVMLLTMVLGNAEESVEEVPIVAATSDPAEGEQLAEVVEGTVADEQSAQAAEEPPVEAESEVELAFERTADTEIDTDEELTVAGDALLQLQELPETVCTHPENQCHTYEYYDTDGVLPFDEKTHTVKRQEYETVECDLCGAELSRMVCGRKLGQFHRLSSNVTPLSRL